MASIYLIEDINDLKYVGSTTRKLNERLGGHRYAKKTRNSYCSSSKLNLYNCIIIELEHCNLEDRTEREKYYINEIDCVNERKLNFDKDKINEYLKARREKNKDIANEKQREYRKKNKEKLNKKQREYREKNKDKINQRDREYRKEWYQKNKENKRKKNNEYYHKNKDKINEKRR